MYCNQGNVALAALLAVCLCGGPVNLSAAPVAIEANFEDSCDVTVWDSTMEDKSVRRVTMQCSDGTITWRSPYGGLQMTFLPPGTRGRHFEACFFASASYAAVKLSIERGNSMLEPVSVLKTPKGFVSGSNADDDEKCFRFTRGQHPVTLYAEVDAALTSLAIGRLTVDYSIRRIAVSDDGSLDDMAECRPCTNDELLERVCTADFAVDGLITDVTDSQNGRWTHVSVDVRKVIHRSSNFVDFMDQMSSSEVLSFQNVESSDQTPIPVDDSRYGDASPLAVPFLPSTKELDRPTTMSGRSVVISIPAVCQVHGGNGRFLFVGHVHLKRSLRMACAPRSEEFWKLWISAVAEGRNPCLLNSEL